MADPFDIQLGGPVKVSPDDLGAAAPPPTTGFMANLDATRREMLIVGNTDAASNRVREAYRPLVEALEEAGETYGDGAYADRTFRTRFVNPQDLGDQPMIGTGQTREAMRRAIFERIRARRAADKNFLPGVADTPEAFEEAARSQAAAELKDIRRVQAGATGWGTVGGFVGGVAGSFRDPVNIATMPIGGASRTFFGAIARSASENMLVEGLSLPSIMGNYAELGEQWTVGDGVRSILFAGGAGAAFRAVPEGAVRAFRGAGPAYDQATGAVFNAMPEPLRKRWSGAATVDDRLLADTIRATVPEAGWTREQRDAVNVLERDADIAEVSPFERTPDGDEAHGRGLAEALQKLIDGVPRRPVTGRAGLMGSTSVAPPPVSRGIVGGGRAAFEARVRGAESGGNDAARNARSSAAGRYQFTDDTWARYHRQIYGGDGLADKLNPAKQERLMAALTDDNEAALRAFGIAPTAGNYYLAHFAGSDGAVKLHRAAPGTSAEAVLGAKVIAANPFLRGMSASDVIDWAARKMGGAAADATPAARVAADAAGDAAGELAEMEALQLARQAADGADGLARFADDDVETSSGERPILKRSLFASDDEWIDAQVRLARSIEDPFAPQSAGNGAPGRADEDVGPFGREFPEAAASWPAALATLRREQTGVVPGALDHPEIGQFDVVWGKPASGPRSRDGMGLAHIIADHPEVNVETLPNLIRAMGVKSRTGNRIVLESADHKAAVSLDWLGEPRGGWLLTAYGKLRDVEKTPPPPDYSRGGGGGRDGSPDRGADGVIADAGAIDNPALKAFDDPVGEGVHAQIESLEHDLRLQAAERTSAAAATVLARNQASGTRARSPRSLLDFIAERGGIEDIGGELRAMDADRWHRAKSFRRKLVLPAADRSAALPGMAARPSRNSAEALFAAAIDADYFPGLVRNRLDGGTYKDLPDIDDFFAAIDEELRGRPLYAVDDQDAVFDRVRREESDDALAAELDQLQALADGAGLALDEGALEHALAAIARGTSRGAALEEAVLAAAMRDLDLAVVDSGDLRYGQDDSGRRWDEEAYNDQFRDPAADDRSTGPGERRSEGEPANAPPGGTVADQSQGAAGEGRGELADDGKRYVVGDDDTPRSLSEILAELDAEDAANAALRGCL